MPTATSKTTNIPDRISNIFFIKNQNLIIKIMLKDTRQNTYTCAEV
jgi:hypothetical protein